MILIIYLVLVTLWTPKWWLWCQITNNNSMQLSNKIWWLLIRWLWVVKLDSREHRHILKRRLFNLIKSTKQSDADTMKLIKTVYLKKNAILLTEMRNFEKLVILWLLSKCNLHSKVYIFRTVTKLQEDPIKTNNNNIVVGDLDNQLNTNKITKEVEANKILQTVEVTQCKIKVILADVELPLMDLVSEEVPQLAREEAMEACHLDIKLQ